MVGVLDFVLVLALSLILPNILVTARSFYPPYTACAASSVSPIAFSKVPFSDIVYYRSLNPPPLPPS